MLWQTSGFLTVRHGEVVGIAGVDGNGQNRINSSSFRFEKKIEEVPMN